MQAILDNDLQVVTSLLETGTRPNFIHLDMSPLNEAVRNGNLPIIRKLIDAGADVNLKFHTSPAQELPLDVADALGDDDIVHFLERLGAESANRMRIDSTRRGLFNAVVENDTVKAQNILETTGLNADFTVEDEATPLDEAIRRRNEEMVRLLVRAGADINRVNSRNEAPFDIALDTGDGAVTAYLESEGAVIGRYPSEKAVQDFLGDKGAKPIFRKETLKDIFAAKNWVGKTDEMEDMWKGVPKRIRHHFDFAAAFAEARRQTIKQSAHKPGLRLTPKPPEV